MSALRVNVRLFASYREKVGSSEVAIELPGGATVGRLTEEVVRRYPGLVSGPENLVVAVNQEYRDHLYALDDGDEVALIPPVSGGSQSWEESYLGQLRKLVGSRRLLAPGTRAFIHDSDGRILFIRRRDNNKWALPAGSMELGETVFEGLKREVNEETGLNVISASLVAVYSGQKVARTDQYGNDYQWLVFQFTVEEWTGTLVSETDETVDAGFFSESELPEAYESYRESVQDARAFTGRVILK